MGFTLGYKVNENTQYEFTVSDETIQEAVQATGGITENDIAPYCYTALTDSRIHSVFIQSSKNVNAAGFDSWQAENMPYYFIRDTRYVNSNTAINKNDIVYERNFLVWNGTIYPGEENEKTGTFLVMDMADIKRWYVDFNAGMFVADTFVSGITEGGVTSAFPGYNGSGYTYVSNTMATPIIHCDNNDPMQNPEENLHIINVLVINDDLWIGHLNPASHGDANTGIVQSTYNIYLDSYVNGYLESTEPTIYQAGSDSWAGIGEIKAMDYPDLGSRTTVYKSYVESSDGVLMEINGNSGGTFDVRTDSGSHCKDLNTLLKWQSWCGLKFTYDNVMYKPIIQQGVIVGYTDDMTEPSEYDTMTNVTGNNISPIPPGPVPPTPGSDDIDDHKMGAGSGISGMANLWLLTKSQLDSLHGAFNSAPAGFDPMNSLISVMGLGVAPTYLFNDIQYITPINIRKSDGTSWSTGVEGHIVDAQKSAFQFTGIKVDRLYNNFLDYSPYAIHEIFIPMCGWLTLPDIAVDRSITVTYLPDVESLKCRAVVSVVDNSGNRCVIGEKDGIMGADVPFTNTGHSLYVGEAIINGMNVAGEVITGAIGAGFTKTNAKGGTYRPYEGFTVGMGGTLPGAIGNALVSGQTNRTHYMTGNGTRIGFSDGENIQIKSTYHKIDKPNNYDHTIGKVCNKTGELSEFKGFTVCDNPHITFSALEEEKEEIKRLLEEGVIL